MFGIIQGKREMKALGIGKMIGNSPIKSVWFIGNGFDIYCGLKTQYSQFLNKYLLIKSEDSDIDKFKRLIENEIDLWSDVEIRIAKITNNNDYRKDINTFLKCFDDLHSHLNKYLKEVETNAKNENCDEVYEKYNKLYKKYFNDIDIETTMFVVLNYTDNFENFIKKKFSGHTEYFYKARIIYVHGNLSEGETIFGIGHPSQIKNRYFRKQSHFREKIIKIVAANLKYLGVYKYFVYPGRKGISKLNVNIFGCSMGQSDSAFWHEIFGRSIIKKIFTLFAYGSNVYSKKLPKITLYNYTSNESIEEFNNFPEDFRQIFDNNYKTSRKAKLMIECLNITNFIPTYVYFIGPVLNLFTLTRNWLLKKIIRKIDNAIAFIETNEKD